MHEVEESTTRYIEYSCPPVCGGAQYASLVATHTLSISGSPTDWRTSTLYLDVPPVLNFSHTIQFV